MPVPNAPPISFADIKSVFGGPQLAPLSAYVRGGAYVPVQTLGSIPTAPPIAIRDFAGAVFPASLAFDTLQSTNGYSFAPPIVAPDLSSIVVAASRTRTVSGGTSWQDITSIDILFDVIGAAAPSVVCRLPATQPRDGNGYWQLASAYNLAKVSTPAQFNPTVLYTTYEKRWEANDDSGPYQGGVRVNTPILPGNAATPPQSTALPVTGGKFRLFLTVTWTMNVGTAVPAYSQMTFNTHNVTNTFVEFPVIMDVYDGGLLVASYESLVRLELDCLNTFNPS